MSSKRAAEDDIIDLTFDSDEEDSGANSNSNSNPSVASAPASKRARTTQSASAYDDDDDDEIIVIDKDEFDKKPAAKPSVKAEPKPSAEVGVEDGIEVVDSSVARPAPAAAAASNIDDEDGELAVVGTRNEYKLPHLRHNCTTCKFTPNSSNREDIRAQNAKHCDLCYCYVCDAPVKDCKSWTSTDAAWQKNHCNATNQHDCWKHKRQQMKDGKFSLDDDSTSRFAQRRSPSAGRNDRSAFDHIFAAMFGFGGPGFDDEDYEDDPLGYDDGDRFGLSHYRNSRKAHAPGQLPSNCRAVEYPACPHCKWHNNVAGMQLHNDQRCFKCGRLAAERKRSNQYSHKYAFKNGHHRLGVREVSFRIVARDVRKDSKFRSSWQEAGTNDSNWQYSEAAMAKSVFDFKIGKRPKLSSLLPMISEWDESTTRQKNEDSILMDPVDINLIREVSEYRLDQVGYRSILHGDVSVVWDEQNSVGSIKIQLDLACLPHRSSEQSHHRLLGCWFNVFPLNLSAISGLSKASRSGSSRSSQDNFGSQIKEVNEEADRLRSSLSLLSSTGKDDVGGFTNTDVSLRGILEKYYREYFADQYIGRSSFDLDKISDHKNEHSRSDLSSVLSHRDMIFVAKCLQNAKKYRKNTGTVLAHAENLGHTPELTCEGLAVEMLEFQKQSLKWAMERETTPGGIQSYWWSKLPINGTELYFNPITGGFRASKPKEVRGGIIAEEMGLGKTIISLALILKHPAPLHPESGSKTECLSNTLPAPITNTPTWNKELHNENSSENGLRGSILSRGTLVICPVSLVGQWIEEAKSKLSNPGLLYPYHGSNRKRDPKILAKNAIVVTTYQVLASDDTYHRKKSSNPDSYCPPLEQVRWWRVICDEGHQLRQPNTNRNRSISRLVADHKWMVTGTPVSTSMFDLTNQLKLLGIESVDGMMSSCCSKPNSRNQHQHIHSPGKLLFLLRNIMMRHTQTQRYRGTNTTLMSLPPKTEKSIEVSLSNRERKEYDALDKAAKDFYIRFKAAHSHKLSSHYLLLSQKLTPLRVACSGGNPPLNPEDGGDKGEDFDDEEEDVKVQRKSEIKYSDFCFTAKLNVLIKELKNAREKDPTSKSLVFSQFNSTLKWLKEELPKHGFEFRTLSGNMSMKQRAKALHDFQADPPTTIFLLSMRAGNCGINLTQANRVFLMEPGFNPALEKQAIGRVHRLGQKRNVEIIRLFVKDTVETRIRKFLETKYGAPSNGSPNKEAKKSTGDEGSEEAETEVMEVPVGNLATERPKNKMVASEFDMLFGVEPQSQSMDIEMPNAIPDSTTSSGML